MLAATPLAIFNTTYVWPKMLAAAYAIAALACVLPAALGTRRPRGAAYQELPIAATLGGFSLLAHGGTVFFFLGAIVWGVRRMGLPTLRRALGALVIAVVVLSPWLTWQRLIDPPGNALVKYSFAGTYGFDEKDKGVLETVVDVYGPLEVGELVTLKRDGAKLLAVGGWTFPDAGWNWFERRRLQDFFFLLPSFTTLTLAILAVMIIPRPRALNSRRIYSASRSLVTIGALGVGLNWLLYWGPHMVHTQAYGSLLVLLLGAVVGSAALLGRFSYLLIAPAFIYGIVTWGVEPFVGAADVDLLAASLCAAAVAVAGWQLRRLHF